MKIRPRNIPKFDIGNKLWYSNILEYDPKNYIWEYDTLSGLKKGDVREGFKNPWASTIAGLDPGRYAPTDLSPEYGTMGRELSHFNYAKTVEDLPYYKEFTNALFDKDNKITPVGMEYIKQSDNLLPIGHNARILDVNGNIKDSITVKLRDAHGRPPEVRTFNLKNPEELVAYINHVRLDLTIGGRHNVFPKVGIRHYYFDNDGNVHWVDNKEAENYERLETPDEGYDENGVYWKDYQLVGPKGSNLQDPNSQKLNLKTEDPLKKEEEERKKGKITANPYGNGLKDDPKDKINLSSRLSSMLPGILGTGRLIGTLEANNRIYDAKLKGVRPNLQQTFRTHRLVVGDEGTKLAYYRRGAQGMTRAALPFTADADRQTAYMMESKRANDELLAQGDLADNKEIRRTSDESNDHEWRNAQRATDVANYNILQLNFANAAKLDIIAQKYGADWTSKNNYLLGIENRIRQKLAENKALLDQIFALNASEELSNDEKLYQLGREAQDAYDNNASDALEKMRAYKKRYNQLLKQQYQLRIDNNSGFTSFFAKSGMKITHKKKDDLLYKTAKDAVDHFRKISKMSDESTQKSRTKLVKLVSPPKTRKMQQGGTAPFMVYTPAALGGETTTSTQASGSSGKSSKEEDKFKNIRELFKELLGKGIPIDVSTVAADMEKFLKRQELFGNDLDSSNLESMYVRLLNKINNIMFNNEQFKIAQTKANSNDALNEFAVDGSGKLVVLNTETGKLTSKRFSDLGENDNPLTNGQLLQMRAYSPDLAFNGEVFQIVSNGIGINKIADYIKSILPNVADNELTIEGYTKKDSNFIKDGIKILAEAPDGEYKFKEYKKNLIPEKLIQVNAALNYISKMLPRNMKTILEVHAGMLKTSINDLIASLLTSGIDTSYRYELDAVTGKAAKDSNGNGKSGDENDMIPAVAFFLGLGDLSTFIIQDKTLDGLKINTISAPITSKGSNTGSITFDKLSNSDFGGQLIMNQATMGDALIALNGALNIIIGDRIYQTELPIDKAAKARGIIKPDLSFLKKIEQADAKLKLMGIDKSNSNNIPTINKVYQDFGLPVLYTISGNKPVLTSEYARFAMVNATATLDAFSEEPEFNDGVREATDKERDLFESMMLSFEGRSKYKLDNGFGPWNWGETKLYNGIIYIPMVNSTISALGGTGYKAKGSEYNEIESLQLQANAAREKGFKAGGNASNL